jgi:uncharacterized protein
MTKNYLIDYIEFPSSDIAATKQFFGSAFGWSFTGYGPSYEAINGAGIDSGIDGGDTRTTATLAVIRTENIEQAERDVVAAGGVITTPAYDFPGGRRFHFLAPGGIELAVWISTE